MSKETDVLLAARLKSAALVMLGAFVAYLALAIFIIDWTDVSFVLLYQAQIAVTAVLGWVAVSLYRNKTFSTRSLRFKELVIFGAPALMFFAYSFRISRLYATEYGFLPEWVSLWLVLIFIYALFIPNTWQRAAVIIGLITAMRLGLTVYLTYLDPVCRTAANAGFQSVSQNILIMIVGAAGATLGVYTIGGLRRQAFRAKQLGQYQLGEKLGSGGMGEVYLAEHQLMKRPCAIKIIRPDKASNARALAQFEREVRAAAALSHWNSIDIFDYGHDQEGTFYYVMEYLPGMNLGELVSRFGPLPAARVIHLLRQTCDALAEAHDAGLIHRDIKPANIFAAQRGGHQDVAKLLDFGLVKPLAAAVGAGTESKSSLVGSPLYMSPEQAVGDEPDVRSDIYAIGAVAYFMLTGRPPFNDRQPIKVLMAHAHENPLPMTKLVPTVPRDLQQVVMRCLAKHPSDRYQSANELRAALDRCDDANGWSEQDANQWWESHQQLQPTANVGELISTSQVDE